MGKSLGRPGGGSGALAVSEPRQAVAGRAEAHDFIWLGMQDSIEGSDDLLGLGHGGVESGLSAGCSHGVGGAILGMPEFIGLSLGHEPVQALEHLLPEFLGGLVHRSSSHVMSLWVESRNAFTAIGSVGWFRSQTPVFESLGGTGCIPA